MLRDSETAPARIDTAALLARVKIADVVREHVVLKRQGAELAGLCPFHKEKTPSFTVVPEKGFCHCFGCGVHLDAIGFTQRIYGISFREACERLDGRGGVTPQKVRVPRRPAGPTPSQAKDMERKARTIEWCRNVWNAAMPCWGTPVERYLEGRAISTLALENPPLRFHPGLMHSDSGQKYWAMLAAIETPDGRFTGLHRTYLQPAPGGMVRKAELPSAKKMAGVARGGCVRLAPARPVLAIAEGIETSLSVMQETGMATWAAMSLVNMGGLALPALVEEVVLCADSDMKDMASAERIVQKAIATYQKQGKAVRVARAAPGTDFNDMLMAGQAI